MRRITIFSIGKSKESWLKEALDEYEKRLKPHIHIKWALFDSEKNFETALLQEKKGFMILDVQGKRVSSEKFTESILSHSHLNIAIGGPEGFSSLIKENAFVAISFSDLTFTHQAIRLLLLEQIYRATQIEKGSSYHK